jgi:hypothetical protein
VLWRRKNRAGNAHAIVLIADALAVLPAYCGYTTFGRLLVSVGPAAAAVERAYHTIPTGITASDLAPRYSLYRPMSGAHGGSATARRLEAAITVSGLWTRRSGRRFRFTLANRPWLLPIIPNYGTLALSDHLTCLYFSTSFVFLLLSFSIRSLSSALDSVHPAAVTLHNHIDSPSHPQRLGVGSGKLHSACSLTNAQF